MRRGEQLRIGQVAEVLGVPLTTVRMWANKGIIPPPRRDKRGWRYWDKAAIIDLKPQQLYQRARRSGKTYPVTGAVEIVVRGGDITAICRPPDAVQIRLKDEDGKEQVLRLSPDTMEVLQEVLRRARAVVALEVE